LFTSVFGYLIDLGLGLGHVTSLYVAVALTFSSTIIIVKLLSDKREIDALHGQIALGFLIVQDLVVVLAMIILSAIGIGSAGEAEGAEGLLSVVLSGGAMVVMVILFVRFLANPLTERLAQAPELMMISAIALAAIFAAVGELVGLGKEVGGLLAGISLASTPYRETIAARLAPLRDFLLLFFFIALGATLDLSLLGAHVVGAAVFSVFVLVGNPLIVLTIMGVMGYRKRTGFLAGLTVAQISEFSLIFVAMGVSLGHVAQDALGLVTMVGLVTIAASTYMITYSHHLYDRVEPLLGIFERKGTPREPRDTTSHGDEGFDVLLFGLGRFGTAIGMRLQKRGVRAGCGFRRRHRSGIRIGAPTHAGQLAGLDRAGALARGHRGRRAQDAYPAFAPSRLSGPRGSGVAQRSPNARSCRGWRRCRPGTIRGRGRPGGRLIVRGRCTRAGAVSGPSGGACPRLSINKRAHRDESTDRSELSRIVHRPCT
jgi:Kef-type K+ transport system membrane component KefB